MFFTTCARARAAAAGGEEEEGGETSSSSSSSESEDVGEKNDNNTSKSNKRLTRKDKGSYAGMLTEIDSYESHEFRRTNLYDTREHVGLEENREKVLNELLERVEEITSSEEYKAAWAKEMAEMEEEEKNGTERILEWETNLVLEAGGTQDHGLNKKVSLKVNVDALMKETGLSEEAMDYIKAICGKRFLKKTNEIRIVCRRYADREHNRQWCLRALYELIEEGQKEFPSGGFKREDIIELNAKRRNELGDSATYVSQN
jgi:nucleolar MIF4G domain-containing protein 1